MAINTNQMMGLTGVNPLVGATEEIATGTSAKAKPNAFLQALANPEMQLFLAELGASINPTGIGGMIGKPTAGAIQRQSQAKAMEEAGTQAQQNYNALIEALSGGKSGLSQPITETPTVEAPTLEEPKPVKQSTDAVQDYEEDLSAIEMSLDKIIGL